MVELLGNNISRLRMLLLIRHRQFLVRCQGQIPVLFENVGQFLEHKLHRTIVVYFVILHYKLLEGFDTIIQFTVRQFELIILLHQVGVNFVSDQLRLGAHADFVSQSTRLRFLIEQSFFQFALSMHLINVVYFVLNQS